MRYILILAFSAAAFVILFGAHFFVYKTAIKFFNLNSVKIKNALIISLLFMAVSFIAAMFVTRLSNSAPAQFFYTLAAIWWGLMVNLIMVSALAWLVFEVIKRGHFKISNFSVGITFLCLALFVTAYGAWNAQNIKVVLIDASVKNLPAEWAGKTAVQITDMHLGAINGKGFLNKVLELIEDIKPDAIFITGDLFDGTYPDHNDFKDLLGNFKAPLGVYFVYGNHETYIGKDKIKAALADTNITLMADDIIETDGMYIIGLDYTSDRLHREVSVLNQIEASLPTILLYHQPTLISEAKAAGVDLQLSGHTHRGQIFPVNFISHLVYGKYFFGYHNESDYTLYTSSGASTWGPPIRTSGSSEIVVVKFKEKAGDKQR